jgi:hypothetical protein
MIRCPGQPKGYQFLQQKIDSRKVKLLLQEKNEQEPQQEEKAYIRLLQYSDDLSVQSKNKRFFKELCFLT